MGIPKFYKVWLSKKGYFGTIKRDLPPNVKSLSFDFNSLIHTAHQLVYGYGDYNSSERRSKVKSQSEDYTEQEVFVTLMNILVKLITYVKPSELIIIAVDGVVPLAKMNQQRMRRYKSAYQSENRDPEESIGVDINRISPGTDFMVRLDKYIQKWLIDNISVLANRVIYSSHMVPGEGEHKIMSIFRDKVPGELGPHIFYGLDTDLVLLTMTLNVSEVYLWRDGKDMDDIIYIDSFKYELIKELNTKTAVQDFILIMGLLGNDFLPHHPALNNYASRIDQILILYKTLNLELTNTINGSTRINWTNFTKFFRYMAASENKFLEIDSTLNFVEKKTFEQSVKIEQFIGNNAMVERRTFDYQKFRTLWYHHILYPKGNQEKIEQLITELGFNPFIVTIDKVNDLIKEYIDGINWYFNYYFSGIMDINKRWFYKYLGAPLFIDIYNYLNKDISDTNSVTTGWMDNGLKLPHVFHQLLLIMPRNSINLLPDPLKFFMNDGSPIRDLYYSSFMIDNELKTEEWMGVPILPPMDVERIINAVATHTLDRNFINSYNPGKTLTFNRNQTINDEVCARRNMEAEIKSANRMYNNRVNRGRGRGRGRGRDTQQ